jgi:prevent-host-death family protein
MSVHPRPEPEHHWQVQEAKQRFSEVLRKAHDEGPQIITRHGEEVAVVVDMTEYRHSRREEPNFLEFLQSAQLPDDFDLYLERPQEWNRDRDISFLTGE